MMLEPSLSLKATRTSKEGPIALESFCDWMEASLLFGTESKLALPEVVEMLVDEEMCADQAEAWRVMDDARQRLAKRARLLGRGYPVEFRDTRLVRKLPWRQVPAYAFCLFLSVRLLYRERFADLGRDFTEQGELFEALTHVALQRVLAGWTIHITGWSRSSPANIEEVVERIANLLGEPCGDILRWLSQSSKDAGLDILCFRPFRDARVAIPVYLVQCASGLNWERKLTTPDIEVWRRLIEFAVAPRRAFATPLSFREEEFVSHAVRVAGLLLDRYRLLEPMASARPWLSRELTQRLNRWTAPRLRVLQWE